MTVPRTAGRRTVSDEPIRNCERNDVPKSKVRKKIATEHARVATVASETSRVKVAGPSSPVYIGIMLGLMVLGLVWLIVYYLWPSVPLISSLGGWNFAVGFGLMIAGLLMTMRWR